MPHSCLRKPARRTQCHGARPHCILPASLQRAFALVEHGVYSQARPSPLQLQQFQFGLSRLVESNVARLFLHVALHRHRQPDCGRQR